MKKIERFVITVESVHQNQGIIIGNCEKEGRKIVKGMFRDIYPSDVIVVYATTEKNKKYGTHYQMTHYIEKKNENWLMKRLKYEFALEDNEIFRYLMYPSKFPKVKTYLIETKTLQNVFKRLKGKGLEDEWLSKIEQEFLWNYKKLLDDAYQLLSYPSIKLKWIEEMIGEGMVKGKKETKAYYYAQQLLKEANGQGHFYLPMDVLETSLQKQSLSVLDISQFDAFYQEKGNLYLKEYHQIEVEIVKHIKNRLKANKEPDFKQTVVGEWEQENGFTLAKNQKEAVWMALNHSFCVVTGGPGVGKTTWRQMMAV